MVIFGSNDRCLLVISRLISFFVLCDIGDFSVDRKIFVILVLESFGLLVIVFMLGMVVICFIFDMSLDYVFRLLVFVMWNSVFVYGWVMVVSFVMIIV